MAQTPRKRPSKNDATLNPSTKSLEWQSMSYRWWLFNTTYAGTLAMRDANVQLLPKHEGEAQLKYDSRLNTAVFTNFVALTLNFLVGKPFSEKVKFREGTPPSLTALESDIDGQGNDLTTVCMDFFQRGYAKAWSWLLIDYPDVGGEVQTLADVQEKGLRPYWCVIDPDNVLADRGMIIEGKWAWTHVRIYSTEIVYDGFEEKTVNQITLYELIDTAAPDAAAPDYRMGVTVFQEDKKDEWKIVTPRRLTTAPRIPLVRFNSTPDGSMALEDLIHLNVRHWQSSADHNAAIEMARFPILAGSGIEEGKAYTIGPYELLTATDAQSKFYYVENNGTAIGVGDKDIQSLEDKMAMYGAQMLRKRPDRETATSRIVDETQNMAPLQIVVIQFMSAMESVCDYTLMWLEDPAYGDDKTYGVDVNLDFALSAEQQRQMAFFENARLQGDCSREQYFAVAKELGYVPEAFDPVANETQIKAETAEELAHQAALKAMGTQGPDAQGTGSPGNNPNVPKIRRSDVPKA